MTTQSMEKTVKKTIIVSIACIMCASFSILSACSTVQGTANGVGEVAKGTAKGVSSTAKGLGGDLDRL